MNLPEVFTCTGAPIRAFSLPSVPRLRMIVVRKLINTWKLYFYSASATTDTMSRWEQDYNLQVTLK